MNTASHDDHVTLFINMAASIIDHEIDLGFVILTCFQEFVKFFPVFSICLQVRRYGP